ncbi:MAG: glycosyltransferase family 1 protein [Enterococcus sp.]|uniref:DUF2922 family protein n=1 Tax=Enterococcus sp. TaxID=35783 RepID=UPI002649593F|nr:glycosyltransferase family 1 protein [Enterococcus sp.]MDN6215435.1 glycosyltransferase family 1 protein [Enterococcus sp.]MDN6518459.1 glycosyltransferase family 1 protein [Enterococcus sp.]MDN6562624.1 glycosyltransferase family 1 protein [Enterococcus sp.]MDN6585145.1 glycosyltransferase family 1 protein [Enterococcus sp.]MDN6617454.1 glycosyltransferase family 1 protein [Enterococcus sp.]
MPTKPVTQRTLFTMGKDNLEKRMLKSYEDSQDADTVLQYLVAVLIRHCLCVSDFSGICRDLVKEILLASEPTEVLRKLAPLFHDAFKGGKEWEQVIHRLYKNKKEYHRYNNRLSDCKKYLFDQTTPVEDLMGQQYKIVSTFEDAVGKSHTWSLRDVDPNLSTMKLDAVMELLSSLTIFEKEDIRRFVKLENAEIANCTRQVLVKKGEHVSASAQIAVVPAEQAEMALHGMSEEERVAFVASLLPEGVILTDTRESEGQDTEVVDEVISEDSHQAVASAEKAAAPAGSVQTKGSSNQYVTQKKSTSTEKETLGPPEKKNGTKKKGKKKDRKRKRRK